MFASHTTATVTIDEVVVTIQKLGWKVLRAAADAAEPALTRAAASAKQLLDAGGPALMEALEKRAEQRAADPALRAEQRYRQFDRDIVLKGFTDPRGVAYPGGIKSWTAEPKLPGAVDDLEEAAAERLHRAILDLTLPPLDPAAAETARKNG